MHASHAAREIGSAANSESYPFYLIKCRHKSQNLTVYCTVSVARNHGRAMASRNPLCPSSQGTLFFCRYGSVVVFPGSFQTRKIAAREIRRIGSDPTAIGIRTRSMNRINSRFPPWRAAAGVLVPSYWQFEGRPVHFASTHL